MIKTFEAYNKGITFKEWVDKNNININLIKIDCSYNNLIDLNGIEEFKNLKHLNCYHNQLTELPDLSQNKELYYLNCSFNYLKDLPDLSKNKKLEELICTYNQLTELPDLSQNKELIDLYCYNNQLPFECTENNNNLDEYIEWYKETYPWKWEGNKYNL